MTEDAAYGRPSPSESESGIDATRMIESGLAYAERGWHVFVLSPTKKPLANCKDCRAGHRTATEREECDHLTCHAFYAATTEPARIAAMFEQHPRGLLAIRTGAVSNLAVVDFDFTTWDSDGAPAATDPAQRTMTHFDKQGLLEGTLMARTGSGGLHLYYGHPGGYLPSGVRRYGVGVDSKADGGYVVAAPSRAPRGTYEWTPDGRHDHPLTVMPPALAALVRHPTSAKEPSAPSSRRRRVGDGALGDRSRGLLTAVMELPEGTPIDRLRRASAWAGEMVAAGEIDECTVVAVLQQAADRIGLGSVEVGDAYRGTIGSGLRAARSAA